MGVSVLSTEVSAYECACLHNNGGASKQQVFQCGAMRRLCASDDWNGDIPVYDSNVVVSLGGQQDDHAEALEASANEHFSSNMAVAVSPEPEAAHALPPAVHEPCEELRHQSSTVIAAEALGIHQNDVEPSLWTEADQSKPIAKNEKAAPKPAELSNKAKNVVQAGQTARMTFEFVPNPRYEESVLAKVATVLPDGSAVINRRVEPLSMTIYGDAGVLPGDKINIPGGTLHQLSKVLARGGRFTVLVSTRPEVLEVELALGRHLATKTATSATMQFLGIRVGVGRDAPDKLRVQEVHDRGLVPAWNKQNPLKQVLRGDWITHVNGDSWSAQEMSGKLSRSSPGDVVKLRVETSPRTLRPKNGRRRSKGSSETSESNFSNDSGSKASITDAAEV